MAIALVPMFFVRSAPAGVNSWTSTGPDGGHVTSVGWHPTRAGVVLAAVGRVFRSTDSGAHWTPVSENRTASGNFVFDPANADRILVGGQPVLRSTDGGASFVPAMPVSGSNGVSKLAITPDGASLYACSGGRVFRTSDFGQAWTELSSGLPGGVAELCTGLRISSSAPGTLYVSFSSSGLYRTSNSGANWTHVGSLAGGVNALAINPVNAQVLLASTQSGLLWRSMDGGVNWSVVASGYHIAFEFDPQVVNRLLAYEAGARQLYVSTDAGGAWLPAAQVPAVQLNSLAFSATSTGQLAVGTTAGFFVSTDAGQSLSFSSAGMVATDLRGIAVSRSAPYRVYAAFHSGPDGVHVRNGSTGAWQLADTQQLFASLGARTVIDALAVDPNDPSVVYAGGGNGVARSLNAGAAWSPVWAGAGYYVGGIAVDPSDTRVLYVASSDTGISRSPNGGSSWFPRNNGLPLAGGRVPMNRVIIDPSDSQRLYAIAESSGALYRTSDAGLNWARVAGGLPSSESVYTIAFDSLQPGRVYLSASSGLFRSQDGGVTWAPMVIPLGTAGIFSLLVDTVVPGNITLVASSNTPGILRSVDYGASWERVPWDRGPFDSPTSPRLGALDPDRPGNLIVGTTGAGVREFQISPDLSLSLSGLPAANVAGSTPTLRLTVRNRTDSLFAAADATASLTLPANLVPATITTSRGSCTRAGQSVACRIGAMQVGDSALIDVTLAATTGTGTVAASAQPREQDLLPSDNQATLAVTVKPLADLGVSFSGVPTSIVAGQAGSAVATVINNGPESVSAANATITATNLTITGATPGGGSCSVSAGTASCSLGVLAAGSTRTISLAYTAGSAGSAQLSGTVISEASDGAPANDSAVSNLTVSTQSSGGGGGGGGGGAAGAGAGGGGGGAIDPWGVLAILSFLALRNRRLVRVAGADRTRPSQGV